MDEADNEYNDPDLTEAQMRALVLLVQGKTHREAAEAAGVSRARVSQWTKESPFRERLEQATTAQVSVEVRRLRSNVRMAINTLCDLAENAASENVRLNAAREILDRVGLDAPDVSKRQPSPKDAAASVANVYQLKTGADAAE